MTEVASWNGAERRRGSDRRIRVEQWTTDRRRAERRRGGIGTHHPDPTQALLDGIDAPQMLHFEPRESRSNGASAGHLSLASEGASVARGLAPRHEEHDAIPSTAAIAGHPLHPAVTPLPIGAFTGALVADIAFAATDDPFFARAARLLTAAGVATGALAAVLGAVDFGTKGQIRSHRAAWLHAAGNAAVLAMGGVSLGLRSRDEEHAAARGGLVLSLFSGLVLLVTAWLGGELSYRDRVGVTEREQAS